MKILYVEDNDSNAIVVRRLVEHYGYELQTARDGNEGIRSAEQSMPDLILMDVNLPGKDGFQVVREIRAKQGPFATLPIIALTARALPTDREECLAAGFTDYLAKPFRIGHLMAIIRTYISSQAG